MKKDWENFLKTAVQAAQVAGAIQRRNLGKVHSIQFKGEINLVTEIDKACEEKIVKRISKEYPDHEILTEESGMIVRGGRLPSGANDEASNIRWGARGESGIAPRWIIDPLDGTTNYAHGYPLFCVSIGLEHKGKIILGVVYEPNMDQLFIGVQGRGATLNGKKIRVSKISILKRALLATGFAYSIQEKGKTENNLNHFKNFIMNAQAVRRDGVAAIDLCYVACGRFDGFWEMDLWPWDISAASLILQEAGGRVTMFDGAPLDIYGKEIMASNGKIHDEMLKVLKDNG
jgi:myo-inositol-1(or 4)-monophosphatase